VFSFFPRTSAAPPALGLRADWRAAALWLLGAALVQTTALHFLAVRGAVPSLILLVVARFASHAGFRAALLFGAAAGLLEDALAGDTGAGWTIATAIVAVLIWGSARFVFVDSTAIFTALVVVAELVREGLFWSVLSLEGYPPGLGIHFAKLALASALYTGLAALAVAAIRARFGRPR